MFELLFGGLFSLVSFVVWAAATLFLLWMLIDCVTKEPSLGNDKLIWALVIILLPYVGAVIYYVVRRPERIRTYGK